MNEQYHFNGKNITTLILNKIELVSELISQKEGISFEDAYKVFLQSKTYQTLCNVDTLLWGENAEYILDDYYRVG
jgi:hypothetical protein